MQGVLIFDGFFLNDGFGCGDSCGGLSGDGHGVGETGWFDGSGYGYGPDFDDRFFLKRGNGFGCGNGYGFDDGSGGGH